MLTGCTLIKRFKPKFSTFIIKKANICFKNTGQSLPMSNFVQARLAGNNVCRGEENKNKSAINFFPLEFSRIWKREEGKSRANWNVQEAPKPVRQAKRLPAKEARQWSIQGPMLYIFAEIDGRDLCCTTKRTREGPLYDWPPIWLDWIWPNKKIGCKLDALKLLNSNQSNWRPSIQWESSYGDFLWPCVTICNVPKCLKSRIIFCQFQLKVYILVLTEILCAQICFITVQFGRRTMFQFLIRVSHQTQNLQTPSSKFRNKSLPSMPTNRIFQRWGFASPRIVCLGLIHLLPRAPAKKHPFSTFLTLGHHHFEKGKGLMEYSI